MAEKTVLVSQQFLKPIKILKWKVSKGNAMSIGRVILLYDFDAAGKLEQRKLKSTQAGTVHRIIAQEGAIVKTGEPLLELKPCIHPTVMKDMCAECGADLRKDDTITTASVPMVHSIPELKVSEELAQKLGKADGERLLKDRKLVLLVDLDQTIIHTTNDNIPPNIKDVYHFQLYGPNSPWYHTRLRPGTQQFLSNVSPMYELHICTFGARNYAHTITMFLDADQRFFSNRILSRDECFDPTSKKANLKALFPCGDNMVCIIDDREDVWSHALNLIHVKPYHFFQHTGDINAPPGLDKHEDDEKEGVDLTKIKVKCKKKLGKLNGKTVIEKDLDLKLKGDIENVTVIENVEKKEEKLHQKGEPVLQQVVELEIENAAETDEKMDFIETNEQINTITEKDKPVIVEENGTSKIKNNGNVKNEINDMMEKENEVEDQDNKNEPVTRDQELIKEITCTISEINSKENVNNYENCITNTDENQITSDISTNNTEVKINVQKVDDYIEIEDPDDYLMYLEDILKKIHYTFYEEYDKMESGQVPDLKKVIPIVRGHVLRGSNLVFSGLVPTHVKLTQSKAYQVARSLGAKVTQDLQDDTTHLVAVRPGTAKVNAGRRRKSIKIVTPDWLWACAERWEHVDEIIFPLNSKGSKNRHPPPHCSSPEHVPNYPVHDTPGIRKRTPSGRFMDTINPLMSFSSDDIADMDKEVEDILDDESDSDDEDKKIPILEEINICKEEESSSSEESLTGEFPRGFKRSRDKSENELQDRLEGDVESSVDEFPSTKFRRGEKLDSDLDIGDSNSEGSIEPPDEVDDGEWNMMGAALEREFLSNN